MNSTEVACGPGLPHQNLLLVCKAVLGLANLQTTIALQVNNYWFGGANDYSFHIRTNSRSDMKPLLIRGQTTIAVALTLYRFAHALWWLFFPIA